MTQEKFSHDIEWIAYTGIYVHMKGNLGMLKSLHQYFGHDVVIVGDCSSLAVTHIGDAYIDNGTTRIKLCDVLLVLALLKKIYLLSNLLIIIPITKTYMVLVLM